MTPPTLLLLAIPLLAGPVLAPERQRGQAMARIVVIGLALGALWVASGITSVADIHTYAATDPSNALFVSITLGLLLGALGPWPLPVHRPSWFTGIPLLLVPLGLNVGVVRWGPLLLGGVLGALPLFGGLAIPGARRDRDPDLTQGLPASLLAVTLLIALAEPLILVILLPVPWLLPWRRSWATVPMARRVLPLVGLVLFVTLAWLALTIAGTPWARFGSFAATQPLSIGAERLLAVCGIGALMSLLAPWPVGRLGPLLTPLPAIVATGYRLATTLAPQGVTAWLPGTALLLVPSALIAAMFGQWRTALGTIALLGALTGSVLGLIGATVLALLAVWASLRPGVPANRVTFFSVPWRATLVAAAVALVVVALLEVEVVMATCLAAGCAIALARLPQRPALPARPQQTPES
ncbi:MAG: hypothetical protein ABI542_07820 [Gemmatimonadota bacterium]